MDTLSCWAPFVPVIHIDARIQHAQRPRQGKSCVKPAQSAPVPEVRGCEADGQMSLYADRGSEPGVVQPLGDVAHRISSVA
mmetsp:Transcript_105472/g.182313  ORF Transcript_105472/g.182313 Transcript_105472/m.182313 type:complete len:81 (-) Transcript_105472:246-488(-)